MAAQLHFVLPQRQRLATRHAQLPFDEVEARDAFGHRVFDLESRIHLHEVEVAGAVEQEFDGAGADVADLARNGHGSGSHAHAQLGVHGRRGGFFDDLLVPALHGAVAFAEVQDVAVRIREHLDLHVTRFDHGTFEDQPAVAERLGRFRSRRAEGVRQVRRALHQAHAATAAASGGLHHHRVADAVRFVLEDGGILVVAVVAGHDSDASGGHALPRTRFVAHGIDRRGRRTDEHETGGGNCGGKLGVLGEKAVTRMNRVRARRARRCEQLVDAQVAVRRREAAERHGIVASSNVHAVPVGVGVDGDGRNSHLPRGAGDARDDLAAVGDEQAMHRHQSNSGKAGTSVCHAGRRRSRLAAMPSRADPARSSSAKSRAAASSAAVRGASRLRRASRFVARSAAGSVRCKQERVQPRPCP